jgi:hypothetical protein
MTSLTNNQLYHIRAHATNSVGTSYGADISFTTNEVVSDQVIMSKSIDYNNGLITQAKLTATESSGSFTYYLTADGTNWEEVTNGVIHTFTNTGTDLRWKAITTGGTLTQVKVEDYH